MIHNPVAIFLIVLLIILLGSELFKRVRIPSIVGMIIAGIAVGPYGFGFLERDASFQIFGAVGILYIMFQAAVEIDMYHLKAQWRAGVLFGSLSFLLPMATGILGTHFILGAGWTSSVLVASMYASHTLVSYPVISRFGLQNSRPVVIAVTGTIVAVLLALFCLAGVVQINRSGEFTFLSLGRLLLLMGIFMLIVGYTFPIVTRRFFRTATDPVVQYIFIFALVFIASLAAQLIGLEAILGAFYSGLVLNKLIPGRSPLMKNIRFVGNAIFIPYFLIGVGMLINVRVFAQGWNVLWIAANMIVVALGCKWLGAWSAGKILGLGATNRRMMFGLTGGKAAATIAAVMIGYSYGMLNEDMMNAAVIMILVCCLVASVETERAAKMIKIDLLAHDLESEMHVPVEMAKQLISVSNPVTSEGLMRLALFMRYRDNNNPVTALFIRSNDDRHQVEMGRNAMQGALRVADEMEVPAEGVERFDLNIVSGISNMAREKNVTEIMIGLHRRASVVDTFYGSLIDRLLRECDRMVIMSRCFIPVDTVERLVIVAPRGAEFETGFRMWVTRLIMLAFNIEARIVFLAYEATENKIHSVADEMSVDVDVRYERMNSWDDFILLSGSVVDDDLLVVIGSRKGSISYSSDLEQMPSFLQRHFSRTNLVVIYPRQF